MRNFVFPNCDRNMKFYGDAFLLALSASTELIFQNGRQIDVFYFLLLLLLFFIYQAIYHSFPPRISVST